MEPQQFYGLWSSNPYFDVDSSGRLLNWGKFNFGPAGYNPGPFLIPKILEDSGWIAGGDFRINKTPGLRVLSLTFMKEHNRLVDEFRDAHPKWSDETLFHEARRKLIAIYQSITFREYLAAAVGQPAVPYSGYKPEVTPGIDHFFTHVAFRYGHSALPTLIPLLDDNLNACPYGSTTWNDVYFPLLWQSADLESPWVDPATGQPTTAVRKKLHVENILRGLSNSESGRVDLSFTDSLRNHMAQIGGPRHGEDLISADIFRPRDIGLPLYNDAREFLGLPRVTSFANITSDKAYQGLLEFLYGDVDRIDTYIGAMAEDHAKGSEMGPINVAGMLEQFTRLRDGDRFFFENPEQFTPEEIEEVHLTKLKDVLLRNWDIDPNSLPVSSFFLNERQLLAFKPTAEFPEPMPHPLGLPWANRNLTDVYKLWWAIDRSVTPHMLTVQLQVQTDGWAGIGFAPEQKGTMKGADIALCRIFDGVPECRDSKALDVGIPILDTDGNGSNKGTDSFTNVTVRRVDGLLLAMFTRPMSNEDDEDWDNDVGDNTRIIFAFNPITNDLKYHGPTRNPDVIINFESEYRGPPIHEPVNEGVTILLYVLCAIGIFLALVYSALVVLKSDYFRFQTPQFCVLVNFGAILGYISVLLILPESQNNGTCKLTCGCLECLFG